jgi:hypothetical protein
MTARRCFTSKVAAGVVSQRAGQKILDMIDGLEKHHRGKIGSAAGAVKAAAEAGEAAMLAASRRADLVRRSAIAQANVLRSFKVYDDLMGDLKRQGKAPLMVQLAAKRIGAAPSPLNAAMRSMLARDPHEIATWSNAFYLARDIRGRAHAKFAEAIEFLRPKALGFKAELARELEVLRALYGKTDVDPEVRAVAEAWGAKEGVAEDLRLQFVDAGGALPERKNWRLPNPTIDDAKVRALGPEKFKELVRAHADRPAMIDFETDLPMTDARFEKLLEEATSGFLSGHVDGLPSAAPRGRPMLANSRDFPRFFVWKSAESWLAIADQVGTHNSVYEAMTGHIHDMARDVAMMRIFGPNPEATKRFILDLFAREPGRLQLSAEEAGQSLKRAVKTNRRLDASTRRQVRSFEGLWAEVTGANRIPVDAELGKTVGDVRSALVAAQMGSAIIASLSDTVTTTMAARFAGLPVMNVLGRAAAMMSEKGAEIFSAQQGLIADSIGQAMGSADRIMGETIRTGTIAKMGSAVIRASGLRRWTATLRNAFGLEMMAHVARERETAFAQLDPTFRQALARHGIDEADWKVIAAAEPNEPRPNALFTRPMDVAEAGTPAARAASEKLAKLIHTEMDYAVIENDAIARAVLVGDSRPGTAWGEIRRGFGFYRNFTTSFIALHFARAFARGFDGQRLTHGALTFLGMTAMGALSLQAKQLLQGRDPYSFDPTTSNGLRAFGASILQGGGLGVFGDIFFVDKTRYGNSWATIVAGPQMSAIESVLGDFLIRNFQRLAQGEETHFLGDALYIGARYTPGASLWYMRLAFQRAIVDQLARMIDPRASDRFRRMEKLARKNWGQEFWWAPGEATPSRVPAIVGAAP